MQSERFAGRSGSSEGYSAGTPVGGARRAGLWGAGHRAPTPCLGAAPSGHLPLVASRKLIRPLGSGFAEGSGLTVPPRFPEAREWGRKSEPSDHVVSLVPGPTLSACVTSLA